MPDPCISHNVYFQRLRCFSRFHNLYHICVSETVESHLRSFFRKHRLRDLHFFLHKFHGIVHLYIEAQRPFALLGVHMECHEIIRGIFLRLGSIVFPFPVNLCIKFKRKIACRHVARPFLPGRKFEGTVLVRTDNCIMLRIVQDKMLSEFDCNFHIGKLRCHMDLFMSLGMDSEHFLSHIIRCIESAPVRITMARHKPVVPSVKLDRLVFGIGISVTVEPHIAISLEYFHYEFSGRNFFLLNSGFQMRPAVSVRSQGNCNLTVRPCGNFLQRFCA